MRWDRGWVDRVNCRNNGVRRLMVWHLQCPSHLAIESGPTDQALVLLAAAADFHPTMMTTIDAAAVAAAVDAAAAAAAAVSPEIHATIAGRLY